MLRLMDQEIIWIFYGLLDQLKPTQFQLIIHIQNAIGLAYFSFFSYLLLQYLLSY